MLYRGGLRVSEALDLYPKDLDAASGAVRVLNGKGGRARTIGLDPGAFAVLGEWLEARRGLGLDGRSPVFCTTRGEPVSASYVRRLLNRLGESAGIEKRVHPHGLRHTHAAQLRAEGVDIGIISKQRGHPEHRHDGPISRPYRSLGCRGGDETTCMVTEFCMLVRSQGEPRHDRTHRRSRDGLRASPEARWPPSRRPEHESLAD